MAPGYLAWQSTFRSLSYRLIGSLFLVIFLLFFPRTLKAATFNLGVGASALEEGDERWRPAQALHLDWQQSWSWQLLRYGREQGPITQEQWVSHVSYLYSLFQSKHLFAKTGISSSYQTLRIDRPEGELGERAAISTNLGLHFGLQSFWQILPSWRLQADWDNSFYLNSRSWFFLVTARKQSLGLSIGWQW